MIQKILISSLSGGEISEKLIGHVDLERYQRSGRRYENTIPFPQGGFTFRSGTESVAVLGDRYWLLDWQIDRTTRVLVELSISTIRVRQDGEIVFTTALAWPSFDMISKVQSASTYDGQFAIFAIASEYRLPVALKYNGESFELDELNPQRIIMPAKPTDPVGSLVPVFGTGDYPGACAFFACRFWLARTPTHPQTIWASRLPNPAKERSEGDPSMWEDFRCFERVTFQVSSLIMFPVDVTGWQPSTSFPAGTRIDKVITEVVDEAPVDTTYSWVSVCAGVTSSVEPVWAKGSSFRDGSIAWKFVADQAEFIKITESVPRDVIADDEAIEIPLSSDQNDAIGWIATGDDLVIGTTTGEWIVSGETTAIKALARLMTRYGSGSTQATKIGAAIVFLQGNHFMEYQPGDRGGQSPDLNALDDEILAPGVIGWDFAQTPVPTLYAWLADGTVASLVYDRASNTIAWHKIILPGGFVVCMTVLAGVEGGDDEVYANVRRGTIYYLERFTPRFSGLQLDAHTVFAAAPETVTLALPFQTQVLVHALDADLAPASCMVGVDNTITVPVSHRGHRCIVGVPYEGQYESLRVLTQTDVGPGIHSPKRIARVALSVYKTSALSLSGEDIEEAYKIPQADYTGDLDAAFPGGWKTRRTWGLKTASPYPATVLGAQLEVEV